MKQPSKLFWGAYIVFLVLCGIGYAAYSIGSTGLASIIYVLGILIVVVGWAKAFALARKEVEG